MFNSAVAPTDIGSGKYVAYLRSWLTGLGRSVSRVEVDELLDLPWPHGPRADPKERPRPSRLSTEIPGVMTAADQDPPRTDLCTPCVHPYPFAADAYVAFPSVYRHYDDSEANDRDQRGRFRNDGPLDVELTVSRDGIHFTRFRTPHVSLGCIGEEGGGSIYMGIGMIRKGDEIWQYFAGLPFTHRNYRVDRDRKKGVLRRIVQRPDGFVSMDADYSGGEITTKSICFRASRLSVNVDCSAAEEMRVEVLDAYGLPIEGYSTQEAISVDRNGTAQEVWWRKEPCLSRLSNRTVRLRFRLRSAMLYSFQLT